MVLAVLRDGRHIVGRLVSFDHFGTLVLTDVRERHIAGGPGAAAASAAAAPADATAVAAAPAALQRAYFADVEVAGLYVVRGENLTLLAEVVRRALSSRDGDESDPLYLFAPAAMTQEKTSGRSLLFCPP